MISPQTTTVIVWSTIVVLTLLGALIGPWSAAAGFFIGVFMAFKVWPRVWKFFS